MQVSTDEHVFNFHEPVHAPTVLAGTLLPVPEQHCAVTTTVQEIRIAAKNSFCKTRDQYIININCLSVVNAEIS